MSSIVDTADHAVEHVKESAVHAAGQAKGSFVELGVQALKLVNTLRAMEMRGVDNLLDRVGLERKGSALRPVLWFAVGAVTAGAIVMILAPTSGKELRDRIVKILDRGRSEAKVAEPAKVAPVAEAKKPEAVPANGEKRPPIPS